MAACPGAWRRSLRELVAEIGTGVQLKKWHLGTSGQARGIEALVSCVSRVCGFGHEQRLPDVRVT
ncbi:MAG: hypothetical protein QF773_08815 [Lentisphaeria bacterium]|nr:hypothetical protein [Lentisphaeria bacterium]